MTGKAGVVLVTSGPGCSNLVTGLATANSEGDPVVAIGGAVPIANRLKQVHQSMDTVNLFRPITKFSAEIDSPQVGLGSGRERLPHRRVRAAGCGLHQRPAGHHDGSRGRRRADAGRTDVLGPADAGAIAAAAALINGAERPVLLLGLLASQPRAAEAVRALLAGTKLPVVCTYQGAGVVSRELFDCFGGRVGLFHNQPADRLLDAADVVVAIGYNPVEYEPGLWNKGRARQLRPHRRRPRGHRPDYRPQVELTGDIAATLHALATQVERKPSLGGCGVARRDRPRPGAIRRAGGRDERCTHPPDAPGARASACCSATT